MNKTILETNEKIVTIEGNFVGVAIDFKENIPVKVYFDFYMQHDKDFVLIINNGDTRTIKELAEALNLIVNELPKEE